MRAKVSNKENILEDITNHEREREDTKVFGFWIYLMTDLIIFGVLFATFSVLRHNTFGGPSGFDLFDMPTALTETLILLTSSFTCSVAMFEVYKGRKILALFWFMFTFLLGFAFLFIEIKEFILFSNEGSDWQRSGFLSSFFTLVGTHGLHISAGLLWMVVAMFHLMLKPLHAANVGRIYLMTLFWHFLDFVWIFIFTVVYGMGHLL